MAVFDPTPSMIRAWTIIDALLRRTQTRRRHDQISEFIAPPGTLARSSAGRFRVFPDPARLTTDALTDRGRRDSAQGPRGAGGPFRRRAGGAGGRGVDAARHAEARRDPILRVPDGTPHDDEEREPDAVPDVQVELRARPGERRAHRLPDAK